MIGVYRAKVTVFIYSVETQKIAYVVDAYASFGRSDALNGKVIVSYNIVLLANNKVPAFNQLLDCPILHRLMMLVLLRLYHLEDRMPLQEYSLFFQVSFDTFMLI
jgi:hypothetical protein